MKLVIVVAREYLVRKIRASQKPTNVCTELEKLVRWAGKAQRLRKHASDALRSLSCEL